MTRHLKLSTTEFNWVYCRWLTSQMWRLEWKLDLRHLWGLGKKNLNHLRLKIGYYGTPKLHGLSKNCSNIAKHWGLHHLHRQRNRAHVECCGRSPHRWRQSHHNPGWRHSCRKPDIGVGYTSVWLVLVLDDQESGIWVQCVTLYRCV